jgi:hypothetical protein
MKTPSWIKGDLQSYPTFVLVDFNERDMHESPQYPSSHRVNKRFTKAIFVMSNNTGHASGSSFSNLVRASNVSGVFT